MGLKTKQREAPGDVRRTSGNGVRNWLMPENEPKGSKLTATCEKLNHPRSISVMLFLLLAGAGALYYANLSPRQFGTLHDDSIYVTTAKASATGEGYRIISLPYEPAQAKYPPFYPFLLSLIWRLSPNFPKNLVPMMTLSVAATVGFLGLSFRYLTKQGYATNWEALAVVALTAINWRTMILATSILSEMVYGVLSILAQPIAEAVAKRKRVRDWVL